MFENLNNSLKTNVTWLSGSLPNMANEFESANFFKTFYLNTGGTVLWQAALFHG